MNSRITVEVVKLPTSRKMVTLFEGDAVARALVDAFGDEDYSKYSIVVNGSAANLQTRLSNGDSVTISKMVKGNN